MSIRTLSVIIFILCLVKPALCEMGSANYRITTSVISGGGGTMSSTAGNYQMTSTLGQPSPLMQASNPPSSPLFSLYPGFWYTLGAGVETCEYLDVFALAFGSVAGDTNYCAACDFDDDGDVDGSDLANVEFEPSL